MTLFEAIVLGVVQGLTEFLPVSSTAHLRIIPALAGWEDPGAAFTAVVQLGTLAAVLIYFYKDIYTILAAVVAGILKGRPFDTHDASMGWMIAAGTLPIVICGLLFKTEIETSLRSLYWVSGALIGFALLLLAAEWSVKKRLKQNLSMTSMDTIGWKEAIFMGFAQCLALIPGASRSGVTITGGLFLNMSRESAARFSFLLSLPSVFAAALFELYHTWDIIASSAESVAAITAATITAGITGYLSIAFLISYLKKHTTSIFIIYRLFLGTGILAFIATGSLKP
ncbi:MAG: undecaprenyl-diphosphatase UppP [Chlorobiaceae bacterium]|nr:undecaprenyl-diphosphatase UppP [Chlorobiaceae bacterium]